LSVKAHACVHCRQLEKFAEGLSKKHSPTANFSFERQSSCLRSLPPTKKFAEGEIKLQCIMSHLPLSIMNFAIFHYVCHRKAIKPSGAKLIH
jgi:hypothetical protein